MSQSNTKRITSRSAKETQALGKRIGRLLIEGDVLLLNGTLGAGKTALAQGIGRGLGVETQVNSPTFVLVASHPGEVPLYHADLYRLTEVDEVEDKLFQTLNKELLKMLQNLRKNLNIFLLLEVLGQLMMILQQSQYLEHLKRNTNIIKKPTQF